MLLKWCYESNHELFLEVYPGVYKYCWKMSIWWNFYRWMHFDNFQCSQWWNFHQKDTFYIYMLVTIAIHFLLAQVMGTKTLHEPILTKYQLDPKEQTLRKWNFNQNTNIFIQENVLKLSSSKWQAFCSSLCVLKILSTVIYCCFGIFQWLETYLIHNNITNQQ